jgi:hypothetical protein
MSNFQCRFMRCFRPALAGFFLSFFLLCFYYFAASVVLFVLFLCVSGYTLCLDECLSIPCAGMLLQSVTDCTLFYI